MAQVPVLTVCEHLWAVAHWLLPQALDGCILGGKFRLNCSTVLSVSRFAPELQGLQVRVLPSMCDCHRDLPDCLCTII